MYCMQVSQAKWLPALLALHRGVSASGFRRLFIPRAGLWPFPGGTLAWGPGSYLDVYWGPAGTDGTWVQESVPVPLDVAIYREQPHPMAISFQEPQSGSWGFFVLGSSLARVRLQPGDLKVETIARIPRDFQGLGTPIIALFHPPHALVGTVWDRDASVNAFVLRFWKYRVLGEPMASFAHLRVPVPPEVPLDRVKTMKAVPLPRSPWPWNTDAGCALEMFVRVDGGTGKIPYAHYSVVLSGRQAVKVGYACCPLYARPLAHAPNVWEVVYPTWGLPEGHLGWQWADHTPYSPYLLLWNPRVGVIIATRTSAQGLFLPRPDIPSHPSPSLHFIPVRGSLWVFWVPPVDKTASRVRLVVDRVTASRVFRGLLEVDVDVWKAQPILSAWRPTAPTPLTAGRALVLYGVTKGRDPFHDVASEHLFVSILQLGRLRDLTPLKGARLIPGWRRVTRMA